MIIVKKSSDRRDLEVLRLIVRIGIASIKSDQNVDRVTKITAERIAQEILCDSGLKTEHG